MKSTVGGNFSSKPSTSSAIGGKRQSKPQLMSELNFSLKSKKQAGATSDDQGFQNLIKPLVSGRVPQSTKHTPANIDMDGFQTKSYT